MAKMITPEIMDGVDLLYERIHSYFSKPTSDAIQKIISANVLAILEVEMKEIQREFDKYADRESSYYTSGKPLEVE